MIICTLFFDDFPIVNYNPLKPLSLLELLDSIHHLLVPRPPFLFHLDFIILQVQLGLLQGLLTYSVGGGQREQEGQAVGGRRASNRRTQVH
jgi:hypothetical protein